MSMCAMREKMSDLIGLVGLVYIIVMGVVGR